MARNVNQLNGYSTQDVKDRVANIAQTTAATVQGGLSKTQDVVSGGLDMAQGILQRNQKSATKNMKKAQKKTQQMQGKMQKNVQSGLGAGARPVANRRRCRAASIAGEHEKG